MYKGNRVKMDRKTNITALIYGVIDAAAAGLDAMAYTYTDAASINLLLTTMIPFAMFFNWVMLKQKFKYSEIVVALVVCLMAILYSIIDKNNSYMNENKPLGDVLALLSAFLYGFESSFNEKYS